MVNSPPPAAARIAFTKASATGLRSTLAIPGRASSSEEICDPPSSADIELAAPALKVAPSYIGPTTPSRIFDRFWAELSLRRSEEHTSELQSRLHLVCRLLLEKKKTSPSCWSATG